MSHGLLERNLRCPIPFKNKDIGTDPIGIGQSPQSEVGFLLICEIL